MENKEIEIVESFRVLTKNIVNFFENNLYKKNNLSCSEISVLGVICENEKQSKKVNITEIANILKITKSAVSQSVTKLEKKGYVKRKMNLFDKKINYISLTKNGIDEYENKHREYEDAILNVSEKMGEKDCQELSKLLKKLSDIICCLGKDEVNA